MQVKPCLLHGDLWSGNYTGVAGAHGPEWAILDPAVYYGVPCWLLPAGLCSLHRCMREGPTHVAGHHEAEFGMSWCAGFSGDFWRGYHSVLPKEPGRSVE